MTITLTQRELLPPKDWALKLLRWSSMTDLPEPIDYSCWVRSVAMAGAMGDEAFLLQLERQMQEHAKGYVRRASSSEPKRWASIQPLGVCVQRIGPTSRTATGRRKKWSMTDIDDVNKILDSIREPAKPGSLHPAGSTSLARKIKSIYYRIFKRYRRLEIKCCTYADGDILIRQSVGKPEREQWVLAIPEEDRNRVIGVVYLERRERIVM